MRDNPSDLRQPFARLTPQARIDYALLALDAVMEEFSGDPKRVYLTGQSRGGNGTWYIAYRNADRFAAIVPICGRVILKTVNASGVPFEEASPVAPEADGEPFGTLALALKDKPIWIFHGDEDVVVSVEESRHIFAEFEKLNGRARYSELPGVNHNSWTTAYADPELRNWLFKQRLP